MLGWYRIDRWWHEWTAQVPARVLADIGVMAHLAAYIGLGLICVFAPLSLASSPAVARYADLLANVIPSMRLFARVSSFPSQAQLTLAVLWTSVPISALIVARVPWFWVPDMTQLRRKPWALLLGTFVLGFIIVTMMRFDVDATHLWGRSARRVAALSNSRILFGITGGLVCGGVALCIGWLCRIPSTAREVLKDDFR